jgi:hypothetical protein
MTSSPQPPRPLNVETNATLRWEELKYQHEFFWQSLVRLLTVLLVSVSIPFVNTTVFEPFPFLAFLFPLIAAFVGGLGMMHLRSVGLYLSDLLSEDVQYLNDARRTARVRTITLLEMIPPVFFAIAFFATFSCALILQITLVGRAARAPIPLLPTSFAIALAAAFGMALVMIILMWRYRILLKRYPAVPTGSGR